MRTKKTKKRYKLLVFFLIQIMIIVCILSYFQNVINPIIIDYAEAKVKTMTTIAVNNAVFNVLDGTIDYGDFINVIKDDGGNISMLQANTKVINDISINTSTQSQNELNKIGEQKLSISLGSLTGFPIFIGLGPDINIRIIPTGSVICKFKSVFDDAGINQTRHRILIEVCADMDVILPISSKKINCVVEIYIAESILIGNIPSTYLQFESASLLNLLPD